MALQGTYDPLKVTMTLAGNAIVGPYAEGTFVKVTMDEDAFSKKVGADGRATRVRNANQGASIEFTLQQSSPANAALSALAAIDRLTGEGVGAFMMSDKSSPTTPTNASAAHAWVKKVADIERGKDLADTTWQIDTEDLSITHGGMVQTP